MPPAHKQTSKPAVSVCIVTWNSSSEITGCLESLLRYTPESCGIEIIVVDNASSDDTAKIVEKEFPQAILIKSQKNAGFAGANNLAIKRAAADTLFFLNPDTVFIEDAIGPLAAYLRVGSGRGIAGCRLLNKDRSVQPSCRKFPDRKVFLAQYTFLKRMEPFRGAYRAYRMKEFDYNSPASVDQVSGAALMITAEALSAAGGGFDERFFMFYEEVDLCLRVKKAGYSVEYFPGASIVHLGGQSRHQFNAIGRVKLKSAIKYWQKNL